MATLRLIRSSIANHICNRSLSTEPAVSVFHPPKLAVRASENDPTHHTKEDIGKFYTIPNEIVQKLYPKTKSLPWYYEKLSETFNETSVIIRQPAVELIDYLKRADYSRPNIRYVLYGRFGNGKSMTLAHAVNYAYNNNFVIVYVPLVWKFFNWAREVVSSEQDPSILELPLDGSLWLKHFETANAELITKLDLRTSKTYEWSQREKTAENALLSELISHGINRPKYSCQVIDALLNELKLHSINNKCKTFVALDGFNGFFQPYSRFKTSEKVRMVPSTNVSLTRSFLSFVKNDWNNGAVVLVADQKASKKGTYTNHFPFHVLQKVGVEWIDPFIPIHVPEYTPLEFQNYLDYFVEKRWLQNPEGIEEIAFVTQRNPRLINTFCANL